MLRQGKNMSIRQKTTDKEFHIQAVDRVSDVLLPIIAISKKRPSIAKVFGKVFPHPAKCFTVKHHLSATEGARNSWLVFKPSKRLLLFALTIGALDPCEFGTKLFFRQDRQATE